ncbi:MAG TPA: 3-(methylthio)propionyl-CoA ligase [Burkholderiales bacterium]|jgi:fatty-acyl-CoA synthase|nr:3-(methylthio)propionyl-CoA ligase [Burkholderiales bacterium]
MQGLMMDLPLLVSSLIEHADRHHGDTEIVSKTVEDGSIHRYTYREAHQRARRLAKAMKSLGASMNDRIGTLAWNGFRHFEIYYAAAGSGCVIHTINPRLFADQISYIGNHAEDKLLFFDVNLAPLVEKLAPMLKSVKAFVAMCGRGAMPKAAIPNLQCYEELLEAEGDDFQWPSFDERTAACLCYTSGTTGNPKGALYSHRSTILHAYGAAMPDALNLSARDVVLPVVPMFHVNAWGIPYSAAMTGTKLVFPGHHLDGKSLHGLFESEGVTMSAGVPTVWLGLLNHMKEQKLKFSTLKSVVIGGSAAPPAMIRTFQEDYGVQVLHAWGMTEMSPLGTVCTFKAKHAASSKEDRYALQNKVGRVIYGVDTRIVNEEGRELPRDGKAFGDLQVRGPWIIKGYFKGEGGDPLKKDAEGRGWFPTGDVVTIDPDGYIQITDRSKDVIKSGGEWISSIDLENIAVEHPAIQEAAVIGVKHAKWDERPIVVAVKKAGQEVSKGELLKFYEGKIAKWWMPEDVVFVKELPHTATGKLSKLTLRQQMKDYKLPG